MAALWRQATGCYRIALATRRFARVNRGLRLPLLGMLRVGALSALHFRPDHSLGLMVRRTARSLGCQEVIETREDTANSRSSDMIWNAAGWVRIGAKIFTRNARSCLIDFDQHAGSHFLKCRHYAHSLRERFQVTKPDFNAIAIDDLVRSPGKGNVGARRGHHDGVPAEGMFEVNGYSDSAGEFAATALSSRPSRKPPFSAHTW